ncbi:CUB domain-containing protein, partial [Oryctes borbonicus]
MYYSQVSPFAMDVLGNTLAFLVLLILCFLCGLSATDLECGGVYTENEITIESPNYLNKPDGHTTCDFIFKDDHCSTQYFFHFVNFYLEKTSDCNATGLEIEGQDVLCGYQNGTKIYYSEYGTLRVKFYSRRHKSDEKFKILVTKIPCDYVLGYSRVKRSFHNRVCKSYEVPNTFDAMQYPRHFYNYMQLPFIQQQNTAVKACCATRYDSKNFLISSPNFPYEKDTGSDCTYHIYRVNHNICKIRLNFLYYWNGYQTPAGCKNGYLEIDEKRICGCNSGLKLVADFGAHYGNFPKVIKFKSNGHSEMSRGFVIEVLQEECLSNSGLINNALHNFPYKQSLCPLIRHDPYIDIRFFYPSFLNARSDLKCSGLGAKDLFALTRLPLWKYMSQCPREKLPKRCLEISDKVGCLSTPGYPFYYPPNLNLCYRFIKSPGYCAVKLIMLDFLIESSYQCSKDYVLLGDGKRYCGHQLYNTFSVLTFVNGTFEDVSFVTDNSISCRGFKAWFTQIPCTGTTPSPTTKPSVTTQDPTLPPTTIFYPTTSISTTEVPVTTPAPTLPPSTITYPITITSTTEEPVTTPLPTIPPTIPPTMPPTTITDPVTVTTTAEPTSTPFPNTTIATTSAPSECVQEYSEKYFQIDINHTNLVDNTCRFLIRKYA